MGGGGWGGGGDVHVSRLPLLSFRQVLRDHNCLQTLLQHLKSHSLTIVSNACGTLWNLSARSPKDQELLWDLGAVSMLRNLVHSKHKMIAMGSAAALRNLLANRPLKYKDAMVVSPGSCTPSLYMRKQKALEAELDAKHLAETFDTMEKQTLKSQAAKKPLRHVENLVKDYASDSGCFDDDEVPNVSSGAETGNSSVLSVFLSSSFLQGQALPRAAAQRRGPEPEKDESGKPPAEAKKAPPLLLAPGDDVSLAAEKLAHKISTTVAKIDKLVEDISVLHTSSDDSFSLSSEDHGLDWQYGPEEAREARAQSCSPCRLSDASGFAKREGLSRAHTLLRLKTAYTSLSNDSLNSGSTSDGYCPKEHMRPCPRTTFVDFKDELHRYQTRPSRLDLKHILTHRPEKSEQLGRKSHDHAGTVAEKPEPLEKIKEARGDVAEKENEATGKDSRSEVDPDAGIHTIKLSPSYQHVPLVQKMDNANPAAGTAGFSGAGGYYPVLSAPLTERLNKLPEKLAAPAAASRGEPERLQKYTAEANPVCLSRCSSLSSLSSADNVLDGQSRSENEMDSDSSLEIIEVEEVEEAPTEEEGRRAPTEAPAASRPISIPFSKKEKMFLRGVSPSRQEDLTPSSSSENYIQETPLVMSRCSSVSSLGSFESPSIASSIPSEPCSEMVSGTVSPSELPDSPGQTMPPSRSKTPLFEPSGLPEKEASQFNIQWENNVKKFMEIADFKERFQMPQDLDSAVYFTVEKPNENFSCASSLSALPLHEHYVQKDVELKLIPPFPDRSGLSFVSHEKREDERVAESQRVAERFELTSDEDIEILKECINSAMPSRFHKVRTTLVSGLPGQVLNPQSKKPVHLPVYMLVPAGSHLGIPKHRRAVATRPVQDYVGDEDSFTDSAEGTPVNFSSTTSLSDETLQYPTKEEGDTRRCSGKTRGREAMGPRGGGGLKVEAMPRDWAGRITSSHSTPTKMAPSYKHRSGSNHASPLRVGRAQSTEAKRGHVPLRNLELNLTKQGGWRACSEGSRPRKEAFPSFCHTTPTEESVYCFYEDSDGLAERSMTHSPKRKAGGPGKGPKKEGWGAKKEPELSSRQAKTKMAPKLRSNLIADETPPCYSLSSSLSSLSDVELCQAEERAQTHGGGRSHRPSGFSRRHEWRAPPPKAVDSSASSLSYNSDDDRVQKGAAPAMPKRRRQATKRRHAEKDRKGLRFKEWRAEAALDDGASERASDLDSVEWKAIQEGANSIVTWLHQAAASFGREPSSESDSILSFVSGLSASSTLQLSLEKVERKGGKKVLAEKKEQSKAFQKGKKMAETPPSRNPRTEKSLGHQKPATNLPVVFRGRTVIYMPKVAKESQSKSPKSTPKKAGPDTNLEAPTKNPNPNQQRSHSLHRPGKISNMVDLTLPKRSATPPARIPRAPSSGSSRTSTPSQPNQKKLGSPSQQQQPPREAGKPAGSASPPSPNPKPVQKSPAPKQHKTQKSPVRIPFMQKPAKKTLLARNPMPVLEEQVGRGSAPKSELRPKAGGKATLPASRLNLVRMPSTRSIGEESDRSGFLRQLTFIKESSGLLMRHRAELSCSEPRSARSQGASPQRGRVGLPTVFLCSSRCNDLKADKPPEPAPRPAVSKVPVAGPRVPSGSRPPRRTSSESPSRLPVKSGHAPPEPFKRYSSSPQINIIRRAASSAPPPGCPEACAGRKKSEEASKLPAVPALGEPEKQPEGNQAQLQQPAMLRGTWKRIRDEDIPHILKSTLPSTALPLVSILKEEEDSPVQNALERKTSDAVVQTEDFSTTKTNSSTSPTLESPALPQITSGCGGGDAEGRGPSKVPAGPLSFPHEGPANSLGNFPPARHSSPSRAARVTPFNYTPSPMVEARPSDKQTEKVQV